MKSKFDEDFQEINNICEQEYHLNEEHKKMEIEKCLRKIGVHYYDIPDILNDFLPFIKGDSREGLWFDHAQCSVNLLSGICDYLCLEQNRDKYNYDILATFY